MIRKIIWYSMRWLRNHKTSTDVTALIYRCIWLIENCPNVEVSVDCYYINIKTSSTEIKLWNENKFYAWLSNGSVNGRKYDMAMPTRKASYDLKRCLEKRGFDIYQKERELIVDISDVKC